MARGTGRAAAWLTVAAGASLVVVPLLVEFVAGDFFLLLPVAFVLFLAAMPGLRRIQGRRDGSFGRWGLGLVVAGVALLVLVTVLGEVASIDDPGVDVAVGILAGLGGAGLLFGLVAFGWGMLRARVLPAAGVWLFLGGTVLALVTEAAEQSLSGAVPTVLDILPPVGFVAAGLGLVTLGVGALEVRHQGLEPRTR